MSDSIIPGAVTVAVTSGKGGVGKTSTAVAVAVALSGRDLDVLLLDADLDGPNVHLVAEVSDPTLGVDKDQLMLTLPTSPHGFRVVTPTSITAADPAANVNVADLIGMARFAAPAQVVIVDLPPGWTGHHETICQTLPDLVLTVAAPTWPAISDHRRHLRAWNKQWKSAVKALRDRDRRRKLDLPEDPTIVAVETMARFTGVPETGGAPITVRRLDAVPVADVDKHVGPIVSIPSAASLLDSANSPEIGKLADLVVDLIGA